VWLAPANASISGGVAPETLDKIRVSRQEKPDKTGKNMRGTVLVNLSPKT
jgi:hypothetical protein